VNTALRACEENSDIHARLDLERLDAMLLELWKRINGTERNLRCRAVRNDS
jgi:hypothetical protein